MVLSNFDLDVKEKNLFCLLGENGAGKTTLVKILSTLVLPDNGQVLINGFDVEKQAAKVKALIGLVTSDERSFFWRLSAQDNLRFFSVLQNLSDRLMNERIKYLINLVGLEESKDKPFRMYSSGMKQRLSIARGLLHDPAILLLDEPTKGLDPTKVMEVRTFIRETLVRKEGKTVLLTTHDLKEAEEVSDEVGILHQGQLRLKVKMDHSHTYAILKEKFIEIVGGGN